jgi:ectoine hydroxylase-related dioxygenase (phytanoyl-CoA dioxygenase family)
MYALSETEIRFFRDAGYFKSKGVVPDENIEHMASVVRDHVKRKVQPYRINSRGEIRRLDQILSRDKIFFETLQLPVILEPLKSLLGPNVEIALQRHNHSTLNIAGDIPFRIHRDTLQWSRAVVTAIIYLEDSSIDNGCTYIAPTTHHLSFAGMPPDGGGGNWADDHDEYKFVEAQTIPVPMKRGGVLFFNSLMFHSVGVNSSTKSRLSTTFAFHSVDELADPTIENKRKLLCGERIYMGSDKKHISGLLAKGEGYNTRVLKE